MKSFNEKISNTKESILLHSYECNKRIHNSIKKKSTITHAILLGACKKTNDKKGGVTM